VVAKTCSGPEVAAEAAPGVGKRCRHTWVGVEGHLQHRMAIHGRMAIGGVQGKPGRTEVEITATSMIQVTQIAVTTVMMMVAILTIEWVHRWRRQVRTNTCHMA